MKTAGVASPWTLPGAITTFGVDLTYASYLQLRTAYDISVLYGVPFDFNDPEDTFRFVKLAFGIKAGEVAGQAVVRGMPAVLRPVAKKIFSGSTLRAVQSLPVVGKHLLQRNIVKFSIPGVTIPVTTAVNYWTVNSTANQAKGMLRKHARILETANRLVETAPDPVVLLDVVWFVAQADSATQEEERILLHRITEAIIARVEDPERLKQFRERIDMANEDLRQALSAVTPEEATKYYEAGLIAAEVNGPISQKETKALKQLTRWLGVKHNEAQAKRIEKEWK